MKKKLKLDLDIPTDKISIIGLKTTLPDYKLVWHINSEGGFGFVKRKDFFFLPLKHEEPLPFSFYTYEDIENQQDFCLLSNRSEGFYLLKEYKEFDYLCLFKGRNSEDLTNSFKIILKKIPNITFVASLALEKIKTLDLLLSDLELHKMSLEK